MTMKLNENQVALILKYGPEKFDRDTIRNETAREWLESDSSRAEKIQLIQDNEHYNFQQVGWQIVADHPEFVMASVTPLPDWYAQRDDPFDLREITYQFVYEYKENMIDHVDDVRKSTGLRPRLFTAAMVMQYDRLEMNTDEFALIANSMGFSPKGLEDLFEKADQEIEQAANLHDLTYHHRNAP